MRLRRVYSRIPLDTAENHILARVLTLWQAKKGERPFPGREELSPRELVSALSHITLCRVLDGGADFQLRIVGDDVREAYGHHLKGRTLSSLSEEIGSTMIEAYRGVVNSGAPILLRGWFEHGRHQLFQREVLILPLGATEVDHILAVGILLSRTVECVAEDEAAA